jgi:membrane-associated phospholipid phosphatase
MTGAEKSRSQDVERQRTAGRGVLVLQIAYLAVVSLFCIWRGVFPSPELLLVVLVVAFMWQRRRRAFLVDLLPFVLLLLSYQALRGFADDLAPSAVNVENLIEWERALFSGVIPAAYLQATLSHQPFAPILNALTNVFYMSHFVVPLAFAMVLWHQRHDKYWSFVFGLLALSFAGFVTFILFPAAPPWWATTYGYLPGGAVSLTNFIFPSVTVLAGPNPVAAMPSLHVAYPVYIALFATVTFGRKAAWTWFLPPGVAFSAVYLGHHYVVDLIAGVFYATVIFLGLLVWERRRVHRG